jgi:hypothetical protein
MFGAKRVMVAKVFASNRKSCSSIRPDVCLAQPDHLLQLLGVSLQERLACESDIQVHDDIKIPLFSIRGGLRDLGQNPILRDLVFRGTDTGCQVSVCGTLREQVDQWSIPIRFEFLFLPEPRPENGEWTFYVSPNCAEREEPSEKYRQAVCRQG